MNLADWLKRSHPVGEQIAMVAALAQAVEEGHGQGTQYAGWSPSRIQIASGGGADLSALDAGNDPKEDLAYTAPEAADGNHTSRSDVYSAGVILYEILAGSHPFGGLSVKQPRGAPKPLGDVRRDLPKDLADAVTACLERDPEWRPADLSYVARVAQEAGAKPGRAPAAAPAAAPGRTSSTGRVPVAGGARRDASPLSTPRGGSSTRLPLILIALVVVAGGGAFAYLKFGQGSSAGGGTATPVPTKVAAATPTEMTPAPTEAAETATPKAVGTPLPSLTDRRPTTAAATATAPPAATTAPTIEPTRVAVATAAPTVVVRTATAPPATAPPTAEPTHVATAAPVEPAALTAVSPPKIKRGQQHLLDVRGLNLRADLKPRFHHKGKDAVDFQVSGQRVVDAALIKVLVVVGPGAQTGAYTLTMVDGNGQATNAVPFEVTQ